MSSVSNSVELRLNKDERELLEKAIKKIEDLINDENIGETDTYSLIEMSILHDFR